MKISTTDTTPFKNLQSGLKETQEKLLQYYKENNGTLNYEFQTDRTYDIVCITGKNSTEKEIGRFYLPLTYKTVTNRTIIFVDFRSTVKELEENAVVTSVESIVRDKTLFSIKVNHLALVTHYILKESIPTDLTNTLVSTFVATYSSLFISNLRLDPESMRDVKLVLGYYYASVIFPEKSFDDRIIIGAKNSIGISSVHELEGLISDKEKVPATIDDLVWMFKEYLPDNRVSKLNKGTLLMLTTSLMFGAEIKQQLLVSVENCFVFGSLIAEAWSNRLFKRTPLTTVLKNQSKFIDIKEFVKQVELFKEKGLLAK